jgi:hypothetical protein
MSDVSSSVPLLLALRSLIDTAIAQQQQQPAPPIVANEREPEYLSVADFAARCSFTEAAVRKLCQEGMPHMRPRPRLIRIPVAKALEWLAARRTDNAEAARLGRVAARRGQ